MIRYYLVAVCVILVDHLAKWLVSANMLIGQRIALIPGMFGLISVRNRGAAFGILQGQREFFIVVTSAALVWIVLYLRKLHRGKTLPSYGLALILGGALGNFIDRVWRGEVVDMIQLDFIDFPVFNLADCFLWIGVACMAIGFWRDSRREDR